MNNKKFFVCIAVAISTLVISILFYGSSVRREGVQRTIDEMNELVVAIETDMPGFFNIEGKMFGCQYDILKAYADDLGLTLRVIPSMTLSECEKMLHNGRVDMVAGLSEHVGALPDSRKMYTTSYVILATRAIARSFGKDMTSLYNELEGGKIVLAPGFKASGDYDMMLDSLRGANIFVSTKDVSAMAESVAEGKYDFMVCEESAAQFVCAMNRNVTRVYDFREKIPVSIAVSGHVVGLDVDFNQWFEEYAGSNEYAMVKYHYFAGGIVDRLAQHNINVERPGRISPYDEVMQEVCDREGADWRFISAIAYTESRFKPDVVSNRGAKGLMQIMPAVSRQFGVADEDVLNPQINIELGIKLLGRIESMMKLPESVSFYDRMALVLASYNCGIGHVTDARRLARKYGYNSNSWNDVSLFLQKKSEDIYYTDDVVRNGVFRGSRQTLAFVSGVMGRYNSYCAIAVN